MSEELALTGGELLLVGEGRMVRLPPVVAVPHCEAEAVRSLEPVVELVGLDVGDTLVARL